VGDSLSADRERPQHAAPIYQTFGRLGIGWGLCVRGHGKKRIQTILQGRRTRSETNDDAFTRGRLRDQLYAIRNFHHPFAIFPTNIDSVEVRRTSVGTEVLLTHATYIYSEECKRMVNGVNPKSETR